jgi:hypothetical protein
MDTESPGIIWHRTVSCTCPRAGYPTDKASSCRKNSLVWGDHRHTWEGALCKACLVFTHGNTPTCRVGGVRVVVHKLMICQVVYSLISDGVSGCLCSVGIQVPWLASLMLVLALFRTQRVLGGCCTDLSLFCDRISLSLQLRPFPPHSDKAAQFFPNIYSLLMKHGPELQDPSSTVQIPQCPTVLWCPWPSPHPVATTPSTVPPQSPTAHTMSPCSSAEPQCTGPPIPLPLWLHL